ncbi:hypothetical protein LTR87_017279 [Friedmanniomyces endolithicus]|nr:hypothetical protein LTR87_017279 [Friedmanniomyces endolithicus]
MAPSFHHEGTGAWQERSFVLKGSFVYLFVPDTNGAKLRIAFYTEQRGSELSKANLEPGNTILVLYAHAHRFVDVSVGLRQEEVGTVKIRPV